MENNRLKAFLLNMDKRKNQNNIIKYSGWYVIMVSLFMIPTFFFILFAHSYNYKAYCTYPEEGEFYHFIVEGEEHCLIDWFYLLIIPIIGVVFTWGKFALPVVVVRFILKYIWKNHGK